MKLNINNRTNIPFEVIGRVFDKNFKGYYEVDKFEENLLEYQIFSYKKKDYKMTLEYKVTCICVLVEELDILAKKVSMKGIRFPRLLTKCY